MPLSPKQDYTIVQTVVKIKDFHDYRKSYVVRPPYQRKSVWSRAKKQSLLDSLIRRYYVPRLVIREVRLSDERTAKEVIDGQQRITAVQEFFGNQYRLPDSLRTVSADLPGRLWENLDAEWQEFIGLELEYQVDVIKSIDDPKNTEHQIIATEIFSRLQQGETLNYMEVAHAKLSSLTRNFVVKYADDQTFDFEKYKPVDNNPDKHPFFSLLNVDNNRMQHLQFMVRFLLVEEGDGYVDLSNRKVEEFINSATQKDGIDNFSYENEKQAQEVLKTLSLFHKIFKDDPMPDNKNGIKELSVEHFIISAYLLVRHLRAHYVVDDLVQQQIKSFIYAFDERRRNFDEKDSDMLSFSNHRQQGATELEVRDRIMRQLFFEHLEKQGVEIKAKDGQRAFSERQRIAIYRRDEGLCQQCLAQCHADGRPESEARVSWSQYQADHVIPHSQGGRSGTPNGQVLCAHHNLVKGAKMPGPS